MRLLAVYLVGDGTANFVKTGYQIVFRRALAMATQWTANKCEIISLYF